jgi:exopolyphosphatase/pppGpp-phosphohydrolase
MKIAVVDIGSNSLRMQISKAENGIFDVIEEFKEMLLL